MGNSPSAFLRGESLAAPRTDRRGPPQRAAVEPHGPSGYTQAVGKHARAACRKTRTHWLRRAVAGEGKRGELRSCEQPDSNHRDEARALRPLVRHAAPEVRGGVCSPSPW